MTPIQGGRGPSIRQLIDWLDGRLTAEGAAMVQHQVDDADARTLALVDWLRGFKTLTRASSVHDVPPIVRQNLTRHFESWSNAHATEASATVDSVARLTFDSRWDLVPAGARGGPGDQETWHLAYTTEEADLVLDLRRLRDQRVRIDGQVLLAPDMDEGPVFEAVALGGGAHARTVDGDELGRFSLASVPDDATGLRLTNGSLVITASVDLSAGR